MRERTFTSYINAEIAPGAESSARQLERLYDRTFTSIQRKAAAASRATAGLAGGGISTGLPRSVGGVGGAGMGAAPRIAAANAVLSATSARTTTQLARQSAEIGRLENHHARLAESMRSTATALQVVQGPLGPMAGRVTALSNAVERLTGFRLGLVGIGAALFAMTAAANHASQLRQKLAPLYDTQEQVNDAFERTARIARDTRSALEPVIDLYQRLTLVGRDVGLTDRQIEQTTRAAAFGARISGGPKEAQKAALTQFSQAIGSNRLGGDELRSIMENAPRIAKAIAAGLSGTENFGKVTIGMLRTLGAEGQLTAQRVAGALGRQLHVLEEESAKIGPTLASSMNSFTTEFTVAINRLDQSVGLTRTFAGTIQFAADNMRELTALVVGLGAAWAVMKVAPALNHSIRQLDTFIEKQNRAFQAGKAASEAESRSAAQNLAALTSYNQQLQEKQTRLQAVTRQAEQDVTTTRARADNLAPQAAIEQQGGFQTGAIRQHAAALRDAEEAERRLIALRRQGTSTTSAIIQAEGQLAQATTRVEEAKKRATTATSRWRTMGMNLLNAINPLGIAVSLLSIAIIELAMAESRAERNAKELEKIQRQLADTVDDATGRIREQNKELRRGIIMQSQRAEVLAREQFAGKASDVAAEALKKLQTGTRDATFKEAPFVERQARPQIPLYMGGAGAQQAERILQGIVSGRGGNLTVASRQLDAIARANPNSKELRDVADMLVKELPNLEKDWRALQTEQARQREAAGKGSENDRRILRGDFSGGRIEGLSPAQLQAAAEEERGRLRDPRYKASRDRDQSLRELEGQSGTLSQKDYIRQRADVLHTYDDEIKQIEKTEEASKKRAEAEKARQERLAEQARDRAAALENLMQEFEDNAPVKQLEKVYDAAARGKRKLQDLIGEQVAGIGRFSAADASRRMELIDRAVAKRGREFLEQTMEHFEDDTPIRRLRHLATEARKAKTDIDKLVGRSVEGFQKGFTQTDADRLKGEIDSYVEKERRRPFTEQLRQYRDTNAVQNLQLQGRDDEANALERALALQKDGAQLQREDLEVIFRQVQAERERNQALEQRQALVQNLVSLADDAKQTIEAALGEVAKGRPDRALTTLFRGLTDSYFKVQIRSVTDKLMAGADQRIKDLVNGRTTVDASISQIANGMNTAGEAALTFADRLREAAARVPDMAVEGGAGALVPRASSEVDAVVGAVLRHSETTVGRFLSVGNPLARMVVGGDNFAQHVARGSSGVDLHARVGTPVYAPFDGTLSWNESKRGGLQAFVTSLDGRLRAGFAHLSDVTVSQVRQGVRVEMGQMIAKTGNTGINPATGRNVDPHLHASLYRDGKAVDPMKFYGKTIDFGKRATERVVAVNAPLPRGEAETRMAALRTVVEGLGDTKTPPHDVGRETQRLAELRTAVSDLAAAASDLASVTGSLKEQQDAAPLAIGGQRVGDDAAAAAGTGAAGFLAAMHKALDDPQLTQKMQQDAGAKAGAAQAPPSIRVIYNQMGRDIGKNIDTALGTHFAEKVGGRLGDVITGAGKGQMASGVASMLGIKQSNTGAAIGGAIGQLAAPFLGPLAPFAPFIGGFLGGTIGGLFKKPKSGSSTVSVDQFGNINAAKGTGNDQASRQQAFGEASNVSAALKGIADTLFGNVKSGIGTISLGYKADDKKQPYRIDPSGQGRVSGAGVLAFDTEQEQVTKAVQLMLQKGVIDGISAASETILQKAGPDLQSAIEKATAIENIPRQLMQIQDPVRFAVMETNREFTKLISYLKEGGATAAQFADASKLYDLERQKAIEQAKSQASDQITSFLNEMMGGANSPLNRRTVYGNARTQIDNFTSDINAGKIVDQGKLLEAARNFQEASRALNGSGQDFFSDFDWLTNLLTKARDNVNVGVGNDPLPDSPFSTDPQVQAIISAANGTNTAIGNQTDVLGGLLKDIKDLLAGGGSDSTAGTSIGILPGFGGGGAVVGPGGGGFGGLGNGRWVTVST